jgi:hypothetical protein
MGKVCLSPTPEGMQYMDITLNTNRPPSAERDPRSRFRAEKPPIGGWLPGIAITPTQASVLNAIVDQLIPGGEGFPAPSEVDVLSFFRRYIAPEGQEPKWFPFLGESEFRERLDALGEDFVRSSPADQVETLTTMEQAEEFFFARVRDMTYYAYYSRPAVITAINRNLEAGRDLRNSPQPFGYSDTMDGWDEQLLGRVKGSYTRTEDVRPVEIPENLRRSSATPLEESQVKA